MSSSFTARAGVAHVEVSEDQAGQRLDNFLTALLKGVPKSHVYRLLRKGEVRVNKGRSRPDYRLVAGDTVRLPPVRRPAATGTAPAGRAAGHEDPGRVRAVRGTVRAYPRDHLLGVDQVVGEGRGRLQPVVGADAQPALAREPVAWGRTAEALTVDNLATARRLCEAGCGFVTIHSDYEGVWDMHGDGTNLNILDGMEAVGRPFDHAVAAFIEDVEARGIANEILLVCCGEMGRTPRINRNGGRDHWGKLAPLLQLERRLSGDSLQQLARLIVEPEAAPERAAVVIAVALAGGCGGKSVRLARRKLDQRRGRERGEFNRAARVEH